MPKLPFNKGTKLRQAFNYLKDCKWHCAKHMPGTQSAKAIQQIRQQGFEIETKYMICEMCGDRTTHRRLVSTIPSNGTITRSALSERLKKRIKQVYGNVEAVTQRTDLALLEVDHRFPQVRWSKSEDVNDLGMSDSDIIAKFQLLTRQNNLQKSRHCEHCVVTGERGTFIGINYFYEGGLCWPEDISPNDERGCIGCFWYDPDKWRESLNHTIARGI